MVTAMIMVIVMMMPMAIFIMAMIMVIPMMMAMVMSPLRFLQPVGSSGWLGHAKNSSPMHY